MIVKGMSYSEIIDEFEKIYQNVKAVSIANINEAPYRSYLMKNKHKTNVFFKPKRIKIDEITILYVIPFAHSWSIYKKLGLKFILCLTYLIDNGMMAMRRQIAPETGKYVYSFFTSHFFDRYRERELEDMNLEKSEVIYHYLVNNISEKREFCSDPNTDEDVAFYSRFSTGLACGVTVERTAFLYKTYISRKDLSLNKTEIIKGLDKEHEEFFGELRKIKEAILADPDWLKDCRGDRLKSLPLIV